MADPRGSSREGARRGDGSRRDFMANVAMGAGLVVSHLTAAAFAIRYLYPIRRDERQRLFVGLRSEIPPGRTIPFTTPQGQTINVVHGQHGFVALSDVCPHLGCRVYWESQRREFICPCHNGVFDAGGEPISGPPAEMGARLSRYEVVTEGDMLFIELAVQT